MADWNWRPPWPRPGPRSRRSNEEVERRLNPYIDANKEAFARYTNLVKTDPEHAVRTLMLKDTITRSAVP